MRHKTCPDCGPLPKSHFDKYVESISEYILPDWGEKWADFGERIFARIFTALGLIKKIKIDYNSPQPPLTLRGGDNDHFDKISLRTGVLIKEGRKRGWEFWGYNGPAGYLNVFEMLANGKMYFFEGLPISKNDKIDDKAAVKKILLKNNLPAPEGKSFWIFNRSQAFKYALALGFPLVVKPRSGSMSHHVTANIKSEKELKEAINRALKYEPTFIVEKYLAGTSVYRATVVGKEKIAVVQRAPANIVGDGINSINQLVEIKIQDPKRGKPRQKDTTLYCLVINDTSQCLLKKQGFTLDSVPANGQKVFLQEKVILDLGADLVEVTDKVHSDNMVLFKKVAEIFEAGLVGIDFLGEDISRSWREQNCGIIELNSLPYIDMHHFPFSGEPVNVAGWICDVIEAKMAPGKF